LIAGVAVELSLDRSDASRMLSAAVAAGLVVKSVASDDARRTELTLTEAGGRRATVRGPSDPAGRAPKSAQMRRE
jgi:DNA-binding MarR family transcriptional regulator